MWLEKTQVRQFSNHSKMAYDILLTPAMLAEPERIFSGAEITITTRRNRPLMMTVRALECLKS